MEEIIYAYTRQQAIEDGTLLDVSPLARDAGFTCPVALTAAAYGRAVEVPEGVDGQDATGRLWDVLMTLRYRIAGAKKRHESARAVTWKVSVRNRPDGCEVLELKAVCGPDDGGTPCITVMLGDED